jgi:asparagine synthase (glutamine-hydrolysing)
MSGIVGIVNLDGAPVDRDLLGEMTDLLSYRGPDARTIWTSGGVGFGHTLLRTTAEAECERQPLSLDGRTWIVADARVDGRRDLVAELMAQGREVSCDRPDVELLWHAYDIWQEGCVDHLIGDFAFSVWDAARRRLFCARDHMGVKPLYYASVGRTIVFSNTLDCVRLHPGVSDRLHDPAVGDFLLFGCSLETDTTIFDAIRQVPPAHTATWTEERVALRRFWTLPIDEPIYYRRWDDYVDRFRELLREAVNDRLRTDRVSILMSGGIDSPTLAATARGLLRERSGDAAVHAFTFVYDGYDEERRYAGLVADHLRIPIHVRDGMNDLVDPDWARTSFRTPEPIPYPTNLASDLAYHDRIASHSRVLFFGEGPDNALQYEWQPYLSQLVRTGRFGSLAYASCSHLALHRRIPLLPTIPRMLFARGYSAPEVRIPDWFNHDFGERVQLAAHLSGEGVRTKSPHPIRPAAYYSLVHPRWQDLFQSFDAAHLTGSLEVRHPYVDVRLLRYMLSVPAVPWCRAKYLIRRAMRGALPELVLRRPKAPLVHDPWALRIRQLGLPPFDAAPELGSYVDAERASQTPANDAAFWIALRVCSLNYWLQNQGRWKQTVLGDMVHGSNRK